MRYNNRKSYWRFDAEETGHVSTEASARRQPEADPHSPRADPRRVGEAGPGHRHGPTASQLQGALDSGRARDKVPAPDPAAAPLGTDDEAAGTPPTTERIEMAMAHEIGREPPLAQASGRSVHGGWRKETMLVAIAAVAAFAVIAAVIL